MAREATDGRPQAARDGTLRPDLCVIGAGEAGLRAALAGVAGGASVVLVDRSEGAFGGAHLHAGCISSKAFVAEAARPSSPVSASGPASDFAARYAQARERARRVSGDLALARTPERLAALGVRVLRAEARFLDPLTLVAGDATIQARRFIVATGGRPAIPAIPGLADAPYLTSDTIFALDAPPESLVVLGGGPLGLELAQSFRRLGAAVVVVEPYVLLPREDRELAACVEARLRAEGVDFRLGARAASIEARPGGVRVLLEAEGGPGEAVEAAALLVATGRAPVVEGLDLDKARVRVEPAGIVVDARMRSANPRIHAIGDCSGAGGQGYRFTHAARRQADIVVADALFGRREAFDPRLTPRVTFTDPEVASVGESEDEARARRKAVRVLRHPFAENERARLEGRLDGMMKLVLTPEGRVLGCAAAGAGAGELIALWTLAIAKGLRLQDVAALAAPNPTLSELSADAARAALAAAAARGEGERPSRIAGLSRALARLADRLRGRA